MNWGAKLFDLSGSIAVSSPPVGAKSGNGEVHVFPVPKPGVPMQVGVFIKGETALKQMIAACENALTKEVAKDGQSSS